MTKELDEAWTTICHYNDEIIHDMGSEYVENPLKEELDIVNNALLELKAIDNANPSEALRKLDYISYLVLNEIDDLKNKELWKSYFDTIKEALLNAQEHNSINIFKGSKKVKIEIPESCCLMDYNPVVIKTNNQIALEIIKEKPFESASCINYITINKNNSNMLDYEHYCMTIRESDRVNEDEFNLLKEVIGEEND